MKKKYIVSLLLISITAINILCSCSLKPKQTPLKKTGFYLDTVISITLYDKNASKHLDKCFEIVDKYDKMFSANNPESDVYKINHNIGNYTNVSNETKELIKIGKYYSELSNGEFDISLGNLTTLWDFKNKTTPPTDQEISNTLGFNYNNILISLDSNGNNQINVLTNKEKLDLGGIAKGYIADKIKDYLLSENITTGIINLGGNVLTLDPPEGENCYNIGIQKPFSNSSEVATSIKVSNKSIVTSGNYQRYFTYNDKLYHHILNTTTGYPIDNDLNSVTIISEKSVDGDALSTITFLKGLNSGISFIESLPNVDAIFITKDNKIYKTSGLNN